MACTDPTRKLVAEFKRQQRRAWLTYLGVFLLLTLCGVGGLVALASPAAGGQLQSRLSERPIPEPREDIDVVAYRLPSDESLVMLARRFWHTEVDAHQVLRYNPALRSVDETLPAGTLVRVPNFRDFPVEELAVY